MRSLFLKALAAVPLVLLLAWPGYGQLPLPADGSLAGPANPPPQTPPGLPALAGLEPCGPAGCPPIDCGDSLAACFDSYFYAGADYLLIRPHFSEAVAFARVDQVGFMGIGAAVRAEELDFDYQSSFRTFFGYQWDPYTDARFTYWHLNNDVHVDGAPAAATEMFVDPFGSLVVLGQSIETIASVQLNVYDWELRKRLASELANTTLGFSAGVRLADIDQFYRSEIFSAAGAQLSDGVFEATFLGAGPRVGIEGETWIGSARRVSLLSRAYGSVLVGDYDVSSAIVTPVQSGAQEASRTRAVPVLEGELGANWQATPSWVISAGWLFQAWMNVGTSGGQFDNPLTGQVFVGADDSDIMSFDGLFVRSTVQF